MDDFNKEILTKRLRVNTALNMLRRAIKDLKETLVRIDTDSTQSIGSIAKNIKRILNILKEISDKQLDIHIDSPYRDPIHDLLHVGPLTRTKVPLDVLHQLISVGFEINCTDKFGDKCLDIAIQRHHYNAIKLLITYGAQSDCTDDDIRTQLRLLAGQYNVLDLFDLLATPVNLNNSGRSGLLPFHTAVSCGPIQTALHLIKLGASVDQHDRDLNLPIGYFTDSVSNCRKRVLAIGYFKYKLQYKSNKLNNKVFMSLLPHKAHDVPILRAILRLQGYGRPDKDDAWLLEMSHQLLQRLHFNEPVRVDFKTVSKREYSECRHSLCGPDHKFILLMVINNVEVCTSRKYNRLPMFCAMYLCSLILVKLQTDFISTSTEIDDKLKHAVTEEELCYVHAIDCVWTTYHQQCHVKSLLRLCILCTRSSMSSLDDASFMSLPVPPYIRKLLTYRDIAEDVFEEWCHGPTISS